jgi:hypothetical protein
MRLRDPRRPYRDSNAAASHLYASRQPFAQSWTPNFGSQFFRYFSTIQLVRFKITHHVLRFGSRKIQRVKKL